MVHLYGVDERNCCQHSHGLETFEIILSEFDNFCPAGTTGDSCHNHQHYHVTEFMTDIPLAGLSEIGDGSGKFNQSFHQVAFRQKIVFLLIIFSAKILEIRKIMLIFA